MNLSRLTAWLLVVQVIALDQLDRVKCKLAINNRTMRLDKSRLDNLKCNDNSFRIELEVSWQNQTSLVDVRCFIFNNY